MAKQKFYQLFKNGIVQADRIDDYIDQWHETDLEVSIYEFLGMTKEEYFKYIKDGTL